MWGWLQAAAQQWMEEDIKKMTGHQLYNHIIDRLEKTGAINSMSVTWENLPTDAWRQAYDDVAAMLAPLDKNISDTPEGIKEMFVGLTQERRQELYKFLHDAFNCRMY